MIEINCHSSIKIVDNGVKIYIDPFHIKKELHDADIILITHDHYDHFSSEDVEKVKNEKTKLFMLKPYNDVMEKDVKISSYPAYNVNKDFHKKEKEYVGYLIELNGIKYYITGDTDYEQYFDFKIDYLLVPIGGTYTFDYKEAAHYTNKFKPINVIPTHYGEIVGELKDFDRFSELIDKDINVIKKI